MNKLMLLSAAFITLAPSVHLFAGQSQFPARYEDKGIDRDRGAIGVHLLVPVSGRNGTRIEAVDEQDSFRDGERFRLAVTPRENGYIYVIYQSSRGDVQMLYPFAEDGDNYLERGGSRQLPSNGWFRFDEDPGVEHVYIFESTERLGDLEEAAADSGGLPQTLLRKYLQMANGSSTQNNQSRSVWRAAGIVVRRLDLDHVRR